MILLIVALVGNHLTNAKHFPLHESYRFPLYGILTSMFLGTVILIITELTYSYFLRHIFKENITLRLALRFLFTSLGIIALLYIPIFYVFGKIEDVDFDLYALTIGLLITLAICAILITAVYALEIYTLYKNQLEQGTLLVKNGNRKKVLHIKEIFYGYTVHKIVYLVEENGTINATDFTLQILESTLEAYGFFRASRNVLLHPRAVKEMKAIENGKLSVVIQPVFLEQEQLKIVVSRYKKKDFMLWFENGNPILPTIEE
ncbi:LytTR family transcriptional regulator DNA-binding domain-containing protein [Aquimarina sp. AU474]|uniref:LytTR family transcriptional regulator DNA-binding domain-containing protein n=1 Tax=Aquimarina sp. AU474 TaxID=2108529 RepID=UPI001357E42C|nr:LytTR family transcriptional regulator DNA-binding domain-containing protein [Aquimarina sp. AU474]